MRAASGLATHTPPAAHCRHRHRRLVVGIAGHGGGSDLWHDLFPKDSNKKTGRTGRKAVSIRQKQSTSHTPAQGHKMERQMAATRCRRRHQSHGRAHPNQVWIREQVDNVQLTMAHSSSLQNITGSTQRGNTHSVSPYRGPRSTARPHALPGQRRLPARTTVGDTSSHAPAVGGRLTRAPSSAAGPTRPA